ncbi:MAG: helix-turn-helix domain-containing protein [Rhodospirillum sp.]|nr:helix-turn-helix domain-containing protein [Rhodospirillum sp.]MCF8491269.1 helix-turn-helix domain-containing protein [Rhodospirillum sp.]MCF8502916.1 helix-turn-helix domain-containing protein [Rhodospirillum sp.]
MESLGGYSIHDHLRDAGVPLRASARFGDGMAAALWERDEQVHQRYDAPEQHTVSLYVEGGEGIRRVEGGQVRTGFGRGSLCVMPAGLDSEWDVAGSVTLLHLYIPKTVFDRAVVETLDRDPARFALRDQSFLRDPVLEGMIRSAILPLAWNEPADRLAVTHAGRMVAAYLAGRHADRAGAVLAKGGLPPQALRRLDGYIRDHLADPLSTEDLAREAGLSPFHFSRMFKQSTGESPHAHVTRLRMDRARDLIGEGMPLAQVAGACGFAGQSHFAKRFREVVGVTPGRYAQLV